MGIALRQSDSAFRVVDGYYTAAKKEPVTGGSVDVGSTDTFKANFLDLVRMLDAKQQSQVVIVCHGTEDGLYMNVTETSDVSAKTTILVDLTALVDAWDDAKATAFKNNAACSEDDLKELVRLCQKIRGHEASTLNIHFRGCKIGKKIDNLVAIRKLLGSKLVSAPSCPMLYASFAPMWSRPQDQDVDKWAAKEPVKTRRREFAAGAGGSRLIMDAEYAGTGASAQGCIQHANDLVNWFSQVYGNTGHGKTFNGPIAAMWPDDTYFLPHEAGYTSQIVTSKA